MLDEEFDFDIELEEKIEQLVQEKKDLVLHQDYEQAAIVRDKVIELKNKLEIYRNFWIGT